jgi:hypothetical protein
VLAASEWLLCGRCWIGKREGLLRTLRVQGPGRTWAALTREGVSEKEGFLFLKDLLGVHSKQGSMHRPKEQCVRGSGDWS